MKLIETVIRQFKLQEVRSALDEMGIENFMASAVIYHGRQKGHAMMFHGSTIVANIVDK